MSQTPSPFGRDPNGKLRLLQLDALFLDLGWSKGVELGTSRSLDLAFLFDC